MKSSCSRGAGAANVAVTIADLLSDIIVYCRSEALKYGLSLETVLDIIVYSNESKLGADGKPVYQGFQPPQSQYRTLDRPPTHVETIVILATACIHGESPQKCA